MWLGNNSDGLTLRLLSSGAAIGVGSWYLWHRRRRRFLMSSSTLPSTRRKEIVARHGGDLVGHVLSRHGVKYLFTLIGGHISPVLVGAEREGIRVVDVRHEVNAVFAADAVSRLSDAVGVACVTAGPGLTNTITAVKNAAMAQSPLILLGGATLGILKGRGSLQDIDQRSLFEGVVKWQVSIKRVGDIVSTLERAFHIAKEGVPGPVFVELPLDLLYPEKVIRTQLLSKMSTSSSNGGGDNASNKSTGNKKKKRMSLLKRLELLYIRYYLHRLYGKSSTEPHFESVPLPVSVRRATDGQVKKAFAYLFHSQRPVVVVGSQAMMDRPHVESVVSSLRTLGLPVYLAGMARGCLGPDSELHMRHGRSKALKQADVVLLLGVPCDFRMQYGMVFSSKTVLVSVNQDRHELYLNRRPTLPVHGSVPNFLIRLASVWAASDNIESNSPIAASWEEWRGQLREACDKREEEIQRQALESVTSSVPTNQSLCNPIAICRTFDKHLSDESILVCDGGDFVGTAAYTVRPRGPLSWLDPGPFGTLGVGAGFALGAKLVYPEKDVWVVWGDGSCAFSVMEFDTFVRHNIPVKAVVGNDACWNQISRDQVTIFNSEVACNLNFSRYDNVAKSLGGKGFLVTSESEMEDALKRTKDESNTPVLVNVLIGKTNFRDGSISV